MKRRTILSTLAAATIAPLVVSKDAMGDVPTETDYTHPVTKPGRFTLGTAPTTANGFFQMFQNKNDMDWSSGDQVASFKYNGFVYWLFGDSMLGAEDPDGSFADGSTMVGNRILLQQGDQLVNAIAGGGNTASLPDPPIHNSTNNERYWTLGMFYANSHLYVLSQRVRNADGGGFTSSGGELAKFYPDPTTGKLTLKGMYVTPGSALADVPGPQGIQWCSEAILSGSYVYIYGSTRASGNPYVLHFSYVARVPVAELENQFAWRFYKKTTNTWVATIAELDQDATNQPDAIVGSQISSVRLIGTKHVMVHKPWNGWGSDVKATTSTTPYGPWSAETTIFTSPAGTYEGLNYETYSPQLHPEQLLTSGKTLVSIAWNGAGLTWEQMLSNADLGKPRFYEVQF